MLALNYGGPGAAKKGDTGLTQAINVARTGASGTQVTTGVRGLDDRSPSPRPIPRSCQAGRLRRRAARGASFAARASSQAQRVEYPK